jgi:ribose 5-phosphate isomerase B
MHIAIGCDHRGYALKQVILNLLGELKHEVEDFGSYSSDPVDYPDIAQKVSIAVSLKKVDCGILICSTGIGMSIAANKIRGIRAALCRDEFEARRARSHNNCNVLCLGAETVGKALNLSIVEEFLKTDFEGGRHERRLEKISSMECISLDNT